MSYQNRGKKQYSAKQKKAFHMGRAFAAGKAGKRVGGMTKKEQESFRNGVKAVRESLVECPSCGYVVDSDGVLVSNKRK